MVLEAVPCQFCGDTQHVQRHGTSQQGKRRYRCTACRRSFLRHYTYEAADPAVQQQITPLILNGSGVRDTARVLGINRNAVSAHLKKTSQVVRVNPAYQPSCDQISLILKVDEMWSYVARKTNPRWLWWVEDALTGQVVAFVFGRRTHQTFRRLLSLLAQAKIEETQWLTDHWCAYLDCLDQRKRIVDKALMQSLERGSI